MSKKQTIDELKAQLAAAEMEERERKEEMKTSYERNRNSLVSGLAYEAETISLSLAALKRLSTDKLADFKELMLEYGSLKGGELNKGNFELKNDDFKVNFSSQIIKGFDERSLLAEDKLKEFLMGFVKKRDSKLFELILGLLERNSITGDLDINNINRLYKLEDKFDDPSWKQSIKLFKEAYNPFKTATYIRFYKKSADGKWVLINLNFSSI